MDVNFKRVKDNAAEYSFLPRAALIRLQYFLVIERISVAANCYSVLHYLFLLVIKIINFR